MNRALLRVALLLAAAACAGSQPAVGGQYGGIRLPLWRVKQSGRPRGVPKSQGTWLRPVTQPAVNDEQLYNHRDACVPLCDAAAGTRGLAAQAQTLAHARLRLLLPADVAPASHAGNTTACWAWARRRNTSRCCATLARR